MSRLLLSCVLVLVSATLASASDSPRGSFGLGVIAGEPTGLSMKLRTGGQNALDAAVAWSLEGRSDLHLHGSFLRHHDDAVEIEDTAIPFYYGIGLRMRLNEGSRDDDIGIRFPVGLAWIFAGGGLETFVELAPILDIAPDTELDVNAAIGLRYIFGSSRAGSRSRGN